MKRVLLISFCFPPRREIGSVRAGGLAKYLPEFGWEPIVITPKLPDGKRLAARVIETDYRDVIGNLKSKLGLDPNLGVQQQLMLSDAQSGTARPTYTKLMNSLKALLTYPDQSKGWIPFASRAVAELSKHESVQAIVSTSPPISTHLIAAKAKQVLNRPWIADLRDLWIDAGTPLSRLPLLQRLLERRTLAKSDCMVTVSAPWAEYLRQRYPGKTVEPITNGFDPQDFTNESVALTSSFSITYAGDLYQCRRDPAPLLEVVRKLIQENIMSPSLVRIRFYGPIDPCLSALRRKYQLEQVVEIHGPVSREEAIIRQKESQLLLLLGIDVPTDPGCYPGKLFEYLANRRPILTLGGRCGVTARLLEETQSGVHIFSKSDLREWLIQSYQQFLCSGQVKYEGKETAINSYTHIGMAKKFAGLLDVLTNGGGSIAVADDRLQLQEAASSGATTRVPAKYLGSSTSPNTPCVA